MPLWQRQYTWRITDHRLLWRDILEQYTVASDVAAASDAAPFLIVDGQQRLTTLMLLLAAIRDAAAKTDPLAIERYNELYLINKFQQGDSYFRWAPTQADRPSFFACIRRGVGRTGHYRSGLSFLPELSPDDEPLDLDRLTAVVVERLAVVDITTGHGDSAHRSSSR